MINDPATDVDSAVLEELRSQFPEAPGRSNPLKPRLSVVETVYHQAPGEDPVEVSYRGARFLKTEEQVYSRRVTVGEEWAPLDAGWLREGASLLLLRNEEGRFTQTIPSPEERDEAEGRVVEVGVSSSLGEVTPFALVSPQDVPLRICPSNLSWVFLRCRAGKAKVTVTLIPR